MTRWVIGFAALLLGLGLCLLTWGSALLLSPVTVPLMAACDRVADWAGGAPRNV